MAVESAAKIQVSPMDEFNRTLIDNVHPPGYVNPEPAEKYNLVVIGAGTAGLVTAAAAASLGARVALVERHLMGGDCLNVGCVPSKALISAARAAATVCQAGSFGTHVEDASVDFGAVMERMRRLRSEISPHDSVERFTKLGIDIFLGQGSFLDASTVVVGNKRLRFRKAVIATGARAAALPIPGLAEAGVLTNESVFSLTERPRRLAVIGAGPIGCELAQAFQRFGSKVSLLEVADQILIREDPDAARIVQQALADDGLDLVLGAKIQSVEVRGGEKVIRAEVGDEVRELTVDEILLGVGRAPNVEGLELEAVGVEYDKAGVRVDERLRTTNPRIYAAGDICFPYKFTHTADFMARIVIQNALFMGRKKTSDLIIPWVTYTDPEIAHVGLYEEEARKKGIQVTTFEQPFDHVDRAILENDSSGLLKVHVREGSDKILGATIVGQHAGEMITELTLAMTANIGLGKISSVIHPYPTESEAVRMVADAYNRTRVTPFLSGLFKKWFAWTR